MARREPRSALQAARWAYGLTGAQAARELQALADQMGEPRVITKETVCDWEAGRGLTLPIVRLLCRFYRSSAEELELVPSNQNLKPDLPRTSHALPASESLDEEHADVDRRTAMASMAVALGAALLELTGSLRQSNVGTQMLSYLEADADRFSLEYAEVPPSRMLGPVRDAFEVTRRYLAGHQPVEHRRRLCRVAGQLSIVLGMTLFNLGEERPARWAFRAAREAAEEAEDRLLGAWVAASECIIPTYKDHPRQVIEVSRRGLGLVPGSRSVVVAKLAALEAKAHASLGERAEARDALALSREVMGITPDPLRSGVFGFPPAKYAFYEGTCHVRLAQADEALAASERALSLYASTRAFMEPTIARLDLAMAQVQRVTSIRRATSPARSSPCLPPCAPAPSCSRSASSSAPLNHSTACCPPFENFTSS